jgi:hypothetical protein
MPSGSVKNVFNHSRLSSPQSKMSFLLSAPLSTARHDNQKNHFQQMFPVSLDVKIA